MADKPAAIKAPWRTVFAATMALVLAVVAAGAFWWSQQSDTPLSTTPDSQAPSLAIETAAVPSLAVPAVVNPAPEALVSTERMPAPAALPTSAVIEPPPTPAFATPPSPASPKPLKPPPKRAERSTAVPVRVQPPPTPPTPPLPAPESESPPLPAAAAPAPGPASPKEACGKRVFLALALCISNQCKKQEFINHPQCVELREQNRRREEQQRNAG